MDRREEIDQSNTDDRLICSITQEVFHDPVRATDGFVYEREAITAWILQNGTSPFTRQPLRVDELQPDARTRRLLRRQHYPVVSYDARDETITLPPLRVIRRINNQETSGTNAQPTTSEATGTAATQSVPTTIAAEVVSAPVIYHHRRPTSICTTLQGICSKNLLLKILLVTIAIVIIAGPSIGMGLGLPVETPFNIITVYSSELNTSFVFTDIQSNKAFYYKTTQVSASKSGSYTFASVSNMYIAGYLYRNEFDPQNSTSNLIAWDNNNATNQKFQFQSRLDSSIYILVIAVPTSGPTGQFSAVITGTGVVVFT